MKRLSLALCLIMAALPLLSRAEPIRFSILMRMMEDHHDEQAMQAALEAAQSSEPAFIIVNGLKRNRERCSEGLYRQRKRLLEQATVPVILSMAASDWAYCRDRQNRPAGPAWLNLLRDQFVGDISANSTRVLNIKHQSAMRAYRSYSENARWVHDRVLFATLHIAANNNQYVEAAGRNHEFEDRQVANREWIRRLTEVAARERLAGIVIFCDGDPLPAPWLRTADRDGYREVRTQLRGLAEKSGLWVLVVQGATADTAKTPVDIQWADRLGHVTLPVGLSTLTADSNAAPPFSVVSAEP
jgi:hypothetical protein